MFTKTLLSTTTALALLAGAAQAQNWGGFYAGGFAVTGEAQFEQPGITYGGSGTSFGVFAGYNFATNSNIVYGVEAEYSNASLSAAPFWPYEVKSSYALRGRVGYAMGDALIYGSLGADIGTIGIFGTSVIDEQVTGISVGAGVEYKIADSMSVRGEFIYTDYGDSYTFTPPGINYSTQTIRLGAAYHF